MAGTPSKSKLQARLERLDRLKAALAVGVSGGTQRGTAALTDERLREIRVGLKRLERGSR